MNEKKVSFEGKREASQKLLGVANAYTSTNG
jgi:hypothetical protein